MYTTTLEPQDSCKQVSGLQNLTRLILHCAVVLLYVSLTLLSIQEKDLANKNLWTWCTHLKKSLHILGSQYFFYKKSLSGRLSSHSREDSSLATVLPPAVRHLRVQISLQNLTSLHILGRLNEIVFKLLGKCWALSFMVLWLLD